MIDHRCECGLVTYTLSVDPAATVSLDVRIKCRCGRRATVRSQDMLDERGVPPEEWPTEPPTEPGFYWLLLTGDGESREPTVVDLVRDPSSGALFATAIGSELSIGYEGIGRWRPGAIRP